MNTAFALSLVVVSFFSMYVGVWLSVKVSKRTVRFAIKQVRKDYERNRENADKYAYAVQILESVEYLL
jgi:hypothetical protein